MFSIFKPWKYIGYCRSDTIWLDDNRNPCGRETIHMWKLFEKSNGKRKVELVKSGSYRNLKYITFSKNTEQMRIDVHNWVEGGKLPGNFYPVDETTMPKYKDNVVNLQIYDGGKDEK